MYIVQCTCMSTDDVQSTDTRLTFMSAQIVAYQACPPPPISAAAGSFSSRRPPPVGTRRTPASAWVLQVTRSLRRMLEKCSKFAKGIVISKKSRLRRAFPFSFNYTIILLIFPIIHSLDGSGFTSHTTPAYTAAGMVWSKRRRRP